MRDLHSTHSYPRSYSHSLTHSHSHSPPQCFFVIYSTSIFPNSDVTFQQPANGTNGCVLESTRFTVACAHLQIAFSSSRAPQAHFRTCYHPHLSCAQPIRTLNGNPFSNAENVIFVLRSALVPDDIPVAIACCGRIFFHFLKCFECCVCADFIDFIRILTHAGNRPREHCVTVYIWPFGKRTRTHTHAPLHS